MRLADCNYIASATLARYRAATIRDGTLAMAKSRSRLETTVQSTDVTSPHMQQSPTFPRRQPKRFSAGYLSTSRVCTECLRGDRVPYLRERWDAALRWVCAAHDVVLLDRCPTCRRGVCEPRNRLQYCRCGVRFATAEARRAPRWTHTVEACYGVALDPDSRSELRGSPYRAACGSLAALVEASLAIDRRSQLPARINWRRAYHEPEIALLERWFDEWPYGARRSLAALYAVDPRGAHRVASEVQMDTFPRLLIGFDSDHYKDYEPIGAAPFALAPQPREIMTKSELVARAGIPFRDLKWVTTRRGARLRPYQAGPIVAKGYDRLWALWLVHQIHATDTVEHASQITGFTQHAINVLSRSGWIRSMRMGPNEYQCRVSGVELCEIVRAVANHARATPDPGKNEIWFSNAIVISALYSRLPKLIWEATTGSLRFNLVKRQCALASDLWIDAIEFAAWLEACIADDVGPEQPDPLLIVGAEIGLRTHRSYAYSYDGVYTEI